MNACKLLAVAAVVVVATLFETDAECTGKMTAIDVDNFQCVMA